MGEISDYFLSCMWSKCVKNKAHVLNTRKIKNELNKKNMNIEVLAEKIDVHPDLLSRWLFGNYGGLNESSIEAIAKVLRVDVAELTNHMSKLIQISKASFLNKESIMADLALSGRWNKLRNTPWLFRSILGQGGTYLYVFVTWKFVI